MKPDVRKGQAPPMEPRDRFGERFRARFFDPAFRGEDAAIARLEEIAWQGYTQGRKAPVTRKAGPEFQDPDYELSVEWYETRNRLLAAQSRWGEAATPSRVLVICASPRNDGTCPGEISKTFRLAGIAQHTLVEAGLEVDFLDLSLLTSDYDRHIHPCKGCVSTAMPLCHWPCSCYPNHSTNQVNDWMAEIYERWVSAHGILLVTPTHWYTMASPLKLMMDRLVCADGGNPDPTATGGKNPEKAKALELQGWDYPKHLAGRTYGVVVHGDVAGIEGTRRALCDWLDWMGLIDAGAASRIDRYIGYYEPYATSHDTLDHDEAVQEEVRNAARALTQAVRELRAGRLSAPGRDLERPRPK
ncbi:flavodoxin family protein [Ramlibacter ginsenosidimutans]|uniref:Flavodoxin family protein n=1 Tax=Ramlibacter ginsenosidimutans TaxID=502333 RepID=A0A934TW73_9BURK|nr:flavodoxin family protein [Ramlibacter ginsenosidimutans]MBK6008589.1 flavodoxin family protein [Ramlibacter ginsenosidimutans]